MNKKIFIVEDHEIVRQGYTMFLNVQDGLEVCGVSRTAEEAMKALAEETPDLFLVDVSLPRMSGIDFLKALRKLNVQIPVLMFSGHDNLLYQEESKKAGANGFVIKQDGPQALLTAIRRIFDEAEVQSA